MRLRPDRRPLIQDGWNYTGWVITPGFSFRGRFRRRTSVRCHSYPGPLRVQSAITAETTITLVADHPAARLAASHLDRGPLACGVDVKPLADGLRRPRSTLDPLDRPQDQLGIGLADGQGPHGGSIDDSPVPVQPLPAIAYCRLTALTVERRLESEQFRMSDARASITTPVARFLAGAVSLTGTTVAGALAATALANPASLAVLGTIATFAGGAALYRGWKADQEDERIREIHLWLEQLVRQQGDFAKALADVPPDAPFAHADVCERLREVSHVLSGEESSITTRLLESTKFAKFIKDSRDTLASELHALQNDMGRLIQMGFDQKALTEDVAQSLGGVETKLEQLHGDIMRIRRSQGAMESAIEEMKSAAIVLPPTVSLLVAKKQLEQRDPRIRVNPTATLSGVRYEVAPAEDAFSMELHLSGPQEAFERAREKMNRGEDVVADELGVTLEVTGAPGHPEERIVVAEIRFYSSRPVTLGLVYVDANGDQHGDLEIPGRIHGGLLKRLSAKVGGSVFTMECELPGQGRTNPQSAFHFNLAAWNGIPVLDLPGFNGLHRVISPLREGGATRFTILADGLPPCSGELRVNSENNMDGVFAALHYIDLARKIARACDPTIVFPGRITVDDAEAIDTATQFLLGEPLSVVASNVQVTCSLAPSDIADLGNRPVTIKHRIESFDRAFFGSEVNLGPATVVITDHADYDVRQSPPAPDRPEGAVVKIKLRGAVRVQVTRLEQPVGDR